MIRRARTVLLVLAATFALGVLGTGSYALADGDGGGGGDGDHHGDHHRCDQGCYSAWDAEWLMMSIEGDRFEIAGGQLAQQKGASDEVKALGARLVADHSKSLKDATDLAEKLGIEVPAEPSPTQQWELRVVATFSGNAFDKWYSDLEVADHKQDIKEAQDEVDMGCNEDVTDDAEDEIPVLQQHLELAEAALAAAGGPPDDGS